MDDFSTWISSSKKGETYFHCKLCNGDFLGGLSAVRKHSKSEKHKKNVKVISNTTRIDTMRNTAKFQTLENQKKEAEIRLAMFITEHNISLRTSDHLVKLVKTLAPESEVLKNVSCNRTKATSIVKNVVGKYGFEILVAKMKTQYFSIIIDESTDKSSVKHLAIIVRMVDNNQFVVKDEFACLQEISNATANGVFEAIMDFFKKNNIPYQNNLIGFASMFGINHSVKTLLENEVKGIFVMKCICHSLALCASYACEKIPNFVEDLVREVYVYMKYSFKRQTEFCEFQIFVESKPHKLLHPSKTTWLSLHSSVKRMIEQYQALKLYFQSQYLIDKKAEQIFSKLSNKFTILYLHFLDFVLPMLTNLNLLFQSQSPQIHTIYYKISTTYKAILDCYLKPEYIQSTDVSKLQYRNPSNFLPSEEIYLGSVCAVAFSIENDFSNQDKHEFFTNCLNFYIECSHQIYKRFPFNSDHMKLLKSISVLDPKNIKKTISVAPIVANFSKLNINMNDIDREWRLLRNHNLNFNLDLMEFWKTVKDLRNRDNLEEFSILNSFVSYVLTLPHSSASVERLFSSINLNKTKIRNRISIDTMTGILHSKNVLITQAQHCYEFNISLDMVRKHSYEMYK